MIEKNFIKQNEMFSNKRSSNVGGYSAISDV